MATRLQDCCKLGHMHEDLRRGHVTGRPASACKNHEYWHHCCPARGAIDREGTQMHAHARLARALH